VPLLVKIAPDLADADVDAIGALALQLGLDGVIATNTTISRDLTTPAAEALGAGGISPPGGRAVAPGPAPPDLVIISVAASSTPTTCDDGATLCQAYTGFVYGGPGWARAIHRGLTRRRTRR
jgi:dihydroorotate dehydrogenase